MRLGRLSLQPFGAFPKKSLAFTPGLNVVLGPNEAGKSTVFNAVRLALLVSTDLPKREREKKIDPYLPASGGDYVRVDLELLKGAETWFVRRRWGTGAFSKLELQGGGTFGDEETVRGKLAELLPARPGTVEHVLLTRQSLLGRTLESFAEEARDSLADLSDILRRAVLETGGVSVDRFIQKVKAERDAAFLRWDRQAGAPEKSKGVQKRWSKGKFGTVVAAWYELDDARALAGKVVAWEQQLDAVNAELRGAGSEAATLASFLQGSEVAARDARERRALEADLRAQKAEADSRSSAVEKWPVAAHRARELEQSLAGAEARRASLQEEQRRARGSEEARLLKERVSRAMRRKAVVEETRTALAGVAKLDRKALAELRAASDALARLEAGLEAAKITVTVAGRAAGEVTTQEDFAPEKHQELGPGRTLGLAAAGRVRIVHKDLEIEVRSGDADASARAEKAAHARATRDELFRALHVRDVEEAAERNREWERLSERLAGAERDLAEELGGERLEDLQADLAAAAELSAGRSLPEVSAELARFETQERNDRQELDQLHRQLSEWESAWGSLDKLVLQLAEARGREAELQARIAAGRALPAGFVDAEAFLAAVEKARSDLGKAEVRRGELSVTARGLEEQSREWGGQSAEELAVQVSDAEEAFAAELRRAEALDRVARQSEALLGSTDGAVTSGLQRRLSDMLAAMTAGRHRELVMEGALPVALSEGEEVSLTWEQLSAGTRDTLALALRLAMADYFLGTADGFMLLDDPLVDMDPERQKAAAAALKTFAERRQLIVFTCHPATAALLGARPLMLAGPAAPPHPETAAGQRPRPGSSRASG
ncbi:MAG TPA: AAA family ATPase [Spirochaetia bacterium]|nr:AAA family ATPase [Spirochaetia bacterium]